MKLNSKQLRDLSRPPTGGEADLASKYAQNAGRSPLYFILEDIYDTYNVGGLFRLADALNIEKIYLCGHTEIPPNHKIVKASVGTYKIVPWVYKQTAEEAIGELRASLKDIRVTAVEQAKGSIDYRKADYTAPVALLVGNETNGVLPETLKLCDQIVEIPMFGINTSLNVIVSAAIVGYHAVGAIAHGGAQESQS